MTAFTSDNVSGIHPDILDAIVRANDGLSLPYGDDEISSRLDTKYSELFETDVVVIPCVTGTASNAFSYVSDRWPHQQYMRPRRSWLRTQPVLTTHNKDSPGNRAAHA